MNIDWQRLVVARSRKAIVATMLFTLRQGGSHQRFYNKRATNKI